MHRDKGYCLFILFMSDLKDRYGKPIVEVFMERLNTQEEKDIFTELLKVLDKDKPLRINVMNYDAFQAEQLKDHDSYRDDSTFDFMNFHAYDVILELKECDFETSEANFKPFDIAVSYEGIRGLTNPEDKFYVDIYELMDTFRHGLMICRCDHESEKIVHSAFTKETRENTIALFDKIRPQGLSLFMEENRQKFGSNAERVRNIFRPELQLLTPEANREKALQAMELNVYFVLSNQNLKGDLISQLINNLRRDIACLNNGEDCCHS